MKPPEFTASISMNTGKLTVTTMTTRRSMVSLLQGPFVNQPSHRSWTSRGVIPYLSQWQPCCINRPATTAWLRKLAHGRELHLIPTGDIAAVVFATELLTQLRNRGVDLDRVSQIRARQDGKMLGKTSNTKHAAQIIAEHIQGWLPTRSVDPDSQHEITSLCNQLAELRRENRSWALQ